MTNISHKFNVNDKLEFRRESGEESESYTCLIKKIKDRLVACVISNKDKGRVFFADGDPLYIYSEVDGEKWITPLKLAQQNSFPLIILTITGEPYPASGRNGVNPPAPLDHIEPIDGETSYTGDTGQANKDNGSGVLLIEEDETPQESFENKMAETDVEELDDMVGVTIRELSSERSIPARQEAMPWNPEMLEDISEIDTSELEAELDADIEETLAGKSQEIFAPASPDELVIDDKAEGESDPLSSVIAAPEADGMMEEAENLDDMKIEYDRTFDLGDVEPAEDETVISAPAPVRTETAAEEGPELLGSSEAFSFKGEEEEQDLYVPEAPEAEAAPTAYKDFFNLRLYFIGEDAAIAAGKHVKAGEKVILHGGNPADEASLGGAEPISEENVAKLAQRLEKLEKLLVKMAGESASGGITPKSEYSAVCLELATGGMTVALHGLVAEGEKVYLDVDRFWIPELKFSAVGKVVSSFSFREARLIRIEFMALSPGAEDSITGYLENGSRYFNILSQALEG